MEAYRTQSVKDFGRYKEHKLNIADEGIAEGSFAIPYFFSGKG